MAKIASKAAAAETKPEPKAKSLEKFAKEREACGLTLSDDQLKFIAKFVKEF